MAIRTSSAEKNGLNALVSILALNHKKNCRFGKIVVSLYSERRNKRNDTQTAIIGNTDTRH